MSPTWNSAISLERSESQNSLGDRWTSGDGKAGLKAEADGCELGELGPEEVVSIASSVTEEDSVDIVPQNAQASR